MGITAGAEDAKYQTKYKELKRKVKDIEAVPSFFFQLIFSSHIVAKNRTMTSYISEFCKPSLASAE